MICHICLSEENVFSKENMKHFVDKTIKHETTMVNSETIVNNLITSIQMSGGYHSIIWNGKDNFGREVASGIYVLKFTSKEYSITRKMTLLR